MTLVDAGPRRRILALASLLFLCAAGPASAAIASPAATKPASLVVLDADTVAREHPRPTARAVTALPSLTPLTRSRTTLPSIGRPVVRDGVSWLEVMVPGRPNGRSGWIQEQGLQTTTTPWSITVDLSSRSVTVFNTGRRTRVFKAVIGKPRTPTPRGAFFVEDVVALSTGSIGAPFALALSARSETLQEFAGGPGQIAIHATTDLSGRLGSAVSHGCIRVSPKAVTWLARHTGAGTLVTVRG